MLFLNTFETEIHFNLKRVCMHAQQLQLVLLRFAVVFTRSYLIFYFISFACSHVDGNSKWPTNYIGFEQCNTTLHRSLAASKLSLNSLNIN